MSNTKQQSNGVTTDVDQPEEKMIFENLSRRNQRTVEEVLQLIVEMKESGDYFNAIKGLMGLMELFKEGTEFYIIVRNMRDSVKDLWKARLEKSKR